MSHDVRALDATTDRRRESEWAQYKREPTKIDAMPRAPEYERTRWERGLQNIFGRSQQNDLSYGLNDIQIDCTVHRNHTER